MKRLRVVLPGLVYALRPFLGARTTQVVRCELDLEPPQIVSARTAGKYTTSEELRDANRSNLLFTLWILAHLDHLSSALGSSPTPRLMLIVLAQTLIDVVRALFEGLLSQDTVIVPGYLRKRNVKTAKAPAAPAPAPVPTNKPIPTSLLDTLPSELIDELIVEQLRGATSPAKDSAKTPQCRCRMRAAAQRWKNNFKLARAPLDTYSDPAWSLACASRYLHAAVFDRRPTQSPYTFGLLSVCKGFGGVDSRRCSGKCLVSVSAKSKRSRKIHGCRL
jgi:hypothetical protein